MGYEGRWFGLGDLNYLLMEAVVFEGPGDLADFGKTVITTSRLTLAFLQRPGNLERFAAAIGADPQTIRTALRASLQNSSEPLAAEGSYKPLTLPLTQTEPIHHAVTLLMPAALKSRGDEYWSARVIAQFLSGPCDARTALLSVASGEGLNSAIASLQVAESPDAKAAKSSAANMHRRLREMMPRHSADELYDLNPKAYHTRLQLDRIYAEFPPEVSGSYLRRVCIRAAANEARMRNAAEVTLDDALLALLQPCTVTYQFLSERGVVPEEWVDKLELALPKHAEGPRWPLLVETLIVSLRLACDCKEGDPADDQCNASADVSNADFPFDDRFVLKGCADDESTIGHTLLKEADLLEEVSALFAGGA